MNNRRIFNYLSLFVCILLSSVFTAEATKLPQPVNSTIIKGLVSSALNGETRTLLPDGRSLVLGGQDDTGKPQADALIQDPDTGTMSVLATSMNYARAWHTATVLPDGKVLVLGGIGADGTVVAQSELFDPQSGIFQPITSGAPEARVFHTATLLTDGHVWIAGGVTAAGQISKTTQLWDPRQKDSPKTRIKLSQSRRNHSAALLPDGHVLIWGGKDNQDASINNGEVYDPATQTLTSVDNPQALLQIDPAIAELRASSPEDNASDVPVDALISMRFSHPLLMKSLNSQTVLLQGPEGMVDATIVGAEGGMLAFVTPKMSLVQGTTYTVTFSGATDANRASTAYTQFMFTTAGDHPLDDQWIPSGDWMTHRTDSKWQALPPLHAPAGVTALAGQVLKLDGNPLARVTLIIDGQKSLTDGTGRFLLKNISAGHHAMKINATTANTRMRAYGIYEVGVDVKGGQSNALNYTIWMTPLDTAHTVTIPSPTLTETVITSPLLPGLELHIPANTVITGDDGRVVTQINITPIPLDRPPFPLPRVPVPTYFTIQPGSSYIKVMSPVGPKGASLFYPNSFHYAPGTQFNFWNYDPDVKGWFVYGQGRVAADASKVIPNPGVVLYEFTGAMVANPNDAPPNGPPPVGPTDTPPGGPPPGGPSAPEPPGNGGEPVNLATGLFVYHKTDLTVADVIPLSLARIYRQNDSGSRAFGIGTNFPYDIFLVGTNNTTPGGGYLWQDLILPDGGRIHFVRTSPCTGSNGYCDFLDAVFENTSSPTDFFGATIKWIGGTSPWQLTKRDGTLYFFPDSDGSTSSRLAALIGLQDRFGNFVQFTRDLTTFNLQQITSPNGRWIKFTYDAGNRVIQAQDNINRTVQYSYDAGGRLSQVTDANGGITKYTYDAFNEMLTIQDPRGITYLANQYDSSGRVVRQTQGDDSIFQFAYTTDPITGNITQTDVTDPRGTVNRTTFNVNGYITSQIFALGRPEQQTAIYVRDANTNLLSSVIDPLLRETDYTYDALGNMQSLTTMAKTAAAATTQLTYDPTFSQLTSLTDPLNHVSTYQRDPVTGNLITQIDALGHQTSYTYLSNGRVQSVTGPLGDVIQFGYDLGDLVSVTYPMSNVTTMFTDGAGRVASTADGQGNATRYQYNNLNLVTQVTDPKGSTTTFSYDSNGNLLSLTDANNHTTTWSYDNMDRVLTRTDPLLRQESYSYDLAGNLVSSTDRKSQVTSRSYDPLNRLKFVGYNTMVNAGVTSYESTVGYTYDSGNRITQVVDSTGGTITQTYDDLNLQTSETTCNTGAPACGLISYGYDLAGRRAIMTVAGQPQITYSYDNANRLTQIAQGTSTVGFSYDTANRRSALTLSNGVNMSYTYDNNSRVIGVTYKFNANTLGNLTYSYDSLGRRTQVGGSFARTGLPGTVSAATYDAANELINWNGTPINYDLNGNMLSDGANAFAWNARNQVAILNSVSIRYDGFGRRTKNLQNTAFLFDGPNAVQELSGSTVTANLISGSIDEIFIRADSTGAYTPLKDPLGSTIALVDGSGNLSTRYAYDPFGNTTASGATNSNAFQYTGRENEGNGLYYYRARYVDTIYGRFISPDPSGLAAGSNQYAYVEDGTPNFADPFGLDKKDPNNCVPTSSLNWIQRAQLEAAEAYVDLTGLTVGFGAGGDAAGGWGPNKWKLGGSFSGSTMIVADSTGQAGFLNSWALGFAGFKGARNGWGGGASAGIALLVSPFSISQIKGPSGSVSAAGGAVLGGGFDLTTSGALTINLGLGAGAEAGFDLQGGSSTFIPFCKK